MSKPLQITFRGMDPSPSIEEHVHAKAAELEQFHDAIIGCHVVVEAPNRRHHKGNLYAVRIDIHVPGGDIVVNREHRRDPAHEDPYVAIRDAFDAAARQLEDDARKRRGQVKHHEETGLGTVAKLFTEDDEVRVVIAEGESSEGPQASTVAATGRRGAAATEG